MKHENEAQNVEGPSRTGHERAITAGELQPQMDADERRVLAHGQGRAGATGVPGGWEGDQSLVTSAPTRKGVPGGSPGTTGGAPVPPGQEGEAGWDQSLVTSAPTRKGVPGGSPVPPGEEGGREVPGGMAGRRFENEQQFLDGLRSFMQAGRESPAPGVARVARFWERKICFSILVTQQWVQRSKVAKAKRVALKLRVSVNRSTPTKAETRRFTSPQPSPQSGEGEGTTASPSSGQS
jgi:hypothetical protein